MTPTVAAAPSALESPASARRLVTRAEYHAMADAGILKPGERVELIEGEIRLMVPIGADHVYAVHTVQEVLHLALGPAWWVRAQSPLALTDLSEPEPDIAVVAGPRSAWKDRPTPSRAELVVEISRSSLATDRAEKASLYASAQIPEYWLVDLAGRRLEVRREPVADELAPLGHRYRSLVVLAPGDSVTPLLAPEAALAVAELF